MKRRKPGSVELIGTLALTLVLTGTIALADPPIPSHQGVLAGAAPMPEVVEFRGQFDYPLFVAAARALLPDGTVDPELFHPAHAEAITELLARPATDGCIDLAWSSSLDSPPAGRDTLADALDESDNVLVGTVTGRIHGFYTDRPGVLVRFVTTETLKGGAGWSESHVFLPVGTFHVGERTLCKTNRSYPAPPELGDQLLVLFDDGWFNDESPILGVGPSDLVTLPRIGSVALPELYRRGESELERASSLDVLEQVRRMLVAGAGR